jgi:hypothetical protein
VRRHRRYPVFLGEAPRGAPSRVDDRNSLLAASGTVEETTLPEETELAIKLGIALIAALLSVTGPARADLRYDTSGEDIYRIESSEAFSKVSYAGTQHLSVRRDGKAWRFEARARYVRISPNGRSSGEARFVQVLEPDGTFEDRIDEDPAFLTILNQPFAVRLDAPTLRDLRTLRGPVPFSATSPLGTEAVLHGLLRPAPGGPIDGRPTVGVHFEAEGAMMGPLPGYATMLVSGTMHMDGTAYYSLSEAVLMALRITLKLNAHVAQEHQSVSVPVNILYRRTIRATAKMPPRAPLVTGGGTVAPATP